LCLFCQNFDISHQGQGQEVTAGELAGIMLSLQNQGCHNLNFVTPSHVVPQILAAVEVAVPQGLNLPLVFNTGGYDRVTTLKLLEGVFDSAANVAQKRYPIFPAARLIRDRWDTLAIAGAVWVDVEPGLAVVFGLVVFGFVFAVNSAVHSYLVLAYTQAEHVALNVGFYYMANAAGRLIGTLLSGVAYQWGGLGMCLSLSVAFLAVSWGLSLRLSDHAGQTTSPAT